MAIDEEPTFHSFFGVDAASLARLPPAPSRLFARRHLARIVGSCSSLHPTLSGVLES